MKSGRIKYFNKHELLLEDSTYKTKVSRKSIFNVWEKRYLDVGFHEGYIHIVPVPNLKAVRKDGKNWGSPPEK